MNKRTAIILREFAKKIGAPYRLIKKAYKMTPRNKRFQFKQNAKESINIEKE